MRVVPVAFDSMGVRSAATLVEARGLRIFIDPGVSYAPRRYGLPPHPRELERVEELSGRVLEEAERCDVIIVSHYHFDHYFPDADIYRDSILLIKHPTQNINFSQRKRAHVFLKYNESVRRADVRYADGSIYELEGVRIRLSPPVPHGREGSRLGYVLMVSIDDGETRFLYTSDSQGPMSRSGLEFVLEEDPDIILICGPPTYMEGYKVKAENIRVAMDNMVRIVKETKARDIIVDHHTLRDLEYLDKIQPVLEAARPLEKRVYTAAEYAGEENLQLEARRRELWEEER